MLWSGILQGLTTAATEVQLMSLEFIKKTVNYSFLVITALLACLIQSVPRVSTKKTKPTTY